MRSNNGLTSKYALDFFEICGSKIFLVTEKGDKPPFERSVYASSRLLKSKLSGPY